MVWRKWNVIVVLILANYLVLATLATLITNSSNNPVPTRAVAPTFTPRAIDLKPVSPIPYDFLSPTPRPTSSTRAPTSLTTTVTAIATSTAPTRPTATSTETPSGPTATLIRPTPTETAGFATPAPAIGTGSTPSPTP